MTTNFNTRDIMLPNGSILQLSVSDEFYSVVKKYFNLTDFDSVTDDHLRHFIFNVTSSALDKSEKELCDEKSQNNFE